MNPYLVNIAVILAFGIAGSVHAQQCVPLQSPSVCDGYFRAGQTQYFTAQGATPNATALEEAFQYLDTTGLCFNCIQNLKTYLCQFIYADCASNFPTFPNRASCDAAVGSCTPADAPLAVRTFVSTAFVALFRGVTGGSATSCASLYTGIIAVAPSRDISSSFSLVPNCTCSVPPVSYCSGAVGYPVWSAIATPAAVQQVEAQVASSVSTTTSALRAVPQASCANCETQLRETFCTGAFFRCSSDRSRLFVPPCKKVCDDAMTTCRIDQLNTPGLLGLIRNQTNAATANLISGTLAQCSAEPFLAIPNGVATTINTTTGAEDFGVRTFASNGSYACHEGLYTAKSKCPCVTAPVAGTACSTHVTWPVWGPIANLSGPQVATATAGLEAIDAICPSCRSAVTRAICTSIFPKCDADNVLVPACENDCATQINTCNVTFLQQQCNTIKDRLPFKASDFGSNCFSSGTPFPSCTLCAPITSASCGPYVTWSVFAEFGSRASALEPIVANLLNSVVNIDGCPGCDTTMKRMVCSSIFVPCTSAGVDRVAAFLLGGGTFSQTDLRPVFSRLDQPCKNECISTLSSCNSVRPTPIDPAIFSCDLSRLSILNTGPLFSNASTCYRHGFTNLPPPTCTVFRVPPGTPAPTANNVAAPSTPTSGSDVSGAGSGVPAAAIAVPIVIIIIAAVAGVFLFLYLKKKWIFKIPAPNPTFFNNDNS